MRYQSTRGGVRGLSFKQAVMMGLADDGGLLLPESIPSIDAAELATLATLPYPELAYRIISRFADDIPAADLRDLLERAYATFDHPDVTPITRQDGIYILELFHGPTLAFKDVALQFLGNLFAYLLAERGETMNIVGATSGDTGSAAIAGVRGKDNINIFILHPHGRVSPIQELQMTTVAEANVFNIAIRGTFDDGQRIVKEIFGDLDFKSHHALGAINSINWARVLAQVVYYFYAWGRLNQENTGGEVAFSVPTGNFGDIFAGYLAKRMGLPIKQLILATNANNILARFVREGDYSLGTVVETPSPSMDIQIASNFERYLFYLYSGDAERVRQAMAAFARDGRLDFSNAERQQVASDFLALSVDTAETLATIRAFKADCGYLLDPHTAVGVRAALTLADKTVPVICLATAHPAKFGEAVQQAAGESPPLPPSLVGIDKRPRRCEILDADTVQIKAYIDKHAL